MIPFQIKPWEYEDWMKNSNEKVSVGAFRDAQNRAYPIDEIDDRWESMAFDDNRCQLIDWYW